MSKIEKICIIYSERDDQEPKEAALFVSLSRRFRNRDRVTLLCSLVALALGVAPSVIFSGVKTAYLGIMLLVMILYVYYEGLTEQDLANELSRQNENVRSMQEKILIGIADLIESRDRSTGTHVKNTSEYVANFHHEKWDGSGYPEGKKADEIPISARIMAIADVYDALTMERVYKKAFPVEKALSIIEEDAGKHFDPLLAPLFVRRIREVPKEH